MVSRQEQSNLFEWKPLDIMGEEKILGENIG